MGVKSNDRLIAKLTHPKSQEVALIMCGNCATLTEATMLELDQVAADGQEVLEEISRGDYVRPNSAAVPVPEAPVPEAPVPEAPESEAPVPEAPESPVTPTSSDEEDSTSSTASRAKRRRRGAASEYKPSRLRVSKDTRKTLISLVFNVTPDMGFPELRNCEAVREHCIWVRVQDDCMQLRLVARLHKRTKTSDFLEAAGLEHIPHRNHKLGATYDASCAKLADLAVNVLLVNPAATMKIFHCRPALNLLYEEMDNFQEWFHGAWDN